LSAIRLLAPSSSPPFGDFVSLLAVVKSIVFKHVNCATGSETRLSSPSPGKKTVKIGVMLKKFLINVEAL